MHELLNERLAFYETTGCVKLRDLDGAADRALRLYQSSPRGTVTEPAMVRLDKAGALALAGEGEEACRVATAVLTEDERAPAASVLIRAREFDALLGPDDSPAVRDWREVLHTVR